MLHMKTITSREFQHQFASLSNSLKAGESVTITKHGKPLGIFTKTVPRRKAPDFLANVRRFGYSKEEGQKLIDKICELS